ncbi:TPA: HNH endonuclease [Vibrio vulnificus]|nr:HNH endonuclease [Vibrio metschnikovii]HAT8515215.1 HNH endonuclease [Vibrio vulnificus]HDZ3743017.1 HNH endonuclease [Vibrio cholerae]HDZ3746655.1 HNH endonuclease [Vibrio cholerae]HDZ3757692.1 HNH endonuclease [Vibrio cholerae]
MKMSKKRQEIWNKSGGKCWYCGCVLPEKGWHADHFEPVYRTTELVPVEQRKNPHMREFRHDGGFEKPERDNQENLVPSCAPCNLFKATFPIEVFRKEIAQQIERARRSSVNFRTAERFGMIEVIDRPVLFWFEKQFQSKEVA